MLDFYNSFTVGNHVAIDAMVSLQKYDAGFKNISCDYMLVNILINIIILAIHSSLIQMLLVCYHIIIKNTLD